MNLKIDEERFGKLENGDAEVDEVSSKIIQRTEEVMKVGVPVCSRIRTNSRNLETSDG